MTSDKYKWTNTQWSFSKNEKVVGHLPKEKDRKIREDGGSNDRQVTVDEKSIPSQNNESILRRHIHLFIYSVPYLKMRIFIKSI